jgi:hypothetical protein
MGGHMIEINARKNKPYYSQRNNTLRPFISCNVTSMVAALDYSGYTFPTDPQYNQPEDSLLNFLLNSPEIDKEYAKVYPTEYQKYIKSGKNPKVSYPPNELHTLLSNGTNLWIGKKRGEITKLRWDLTFQEVLFEFLQGRPVVISGAFGNLRHIVCAVGFDTEQENIKEVLKLQDIDVLKVKSIIIEDPYGDYKTSYLNPQGKDIRMPVSDFHTKINVQNQPQKWGHLFIPA